MVGWRFNEAQFRSDILKYTDEEIVRLGKASSPAAQRWADPLTIEENEIKYRILRAEWLRRHPPKKKPAAQGQPYAARGNPAPPQSGTRSGSAPSPAPGEGASRTHRGDAWRRTR
jgi:hypothetical protein